MTSQNKEEGPSPIGRGNCELAEVVETGMCGRNPSPSQRTLHWLFKHNAHRDLDPTWSPGLAASRKNVLRTTRFAAMSPFFPDVGE